MNCASVRLLSRLAAIAAFAVCPLAAQKQTPAPAPVPTPTKPPASTTPSTATTSPDLIDTTRGILLTGRLVLLDGLPPDEMIPVLLDCPGLPASGSSAEERRTVADTQGEFRFRLQLSFGSSKDFETLNKYSSGRVVVNQPSFEVLRANLRRLDLRLGADIGQLVLKPLDQGEGSVISVNSLHAPEPARKELIKGRQELAAGHADLAQKRFEKAIARFPDYATAWFDLGKLQLTQGAKDQAAESFRHASSADLKFLSPRIQLALLAATGLRWEEAEANSAAVIGLSPGGYPGMYLVHAIACFNLKKLDEAEKSARTGLDLDAGRQFPKLANILGAVLERRGDRAGAAAALRLYLERAPQAPDAEKVRARLQALLQ